MIDVTGLLGQPAISLGEAETRGSVRGLHFEGNRIDAIDIGDGQVVPASAIPTLEGDALTFEPATVPAPGAAAATDATDVRRRRRDDEDTRRFGSPIGTALLSETGSALGTVAAMYVDAQGTVVSVADSDGGNYPGDRVRAVGPDATIVSDPATPCVTSPRAPADAGT